MAFWTSQENEFLLRNQKLNPIDRFTKYETARFTPRTSAAIERQLRRLRAIELVDQILSDEEISEESEIVNRPDPVVIPLPELASHLGIYPKPDKAKIQEDRNNFQQFVQELLDLSRRLPNQPDYVPINEGSSIGIVLSDTHIGKVTKFFDSTVFRNRILSITDKLGALELPSDVQEIVLILAGDMLEGEDIYASQAHHIEFCVLDQVQHAVDALWSLAVNLREVFKIPVRFVTCPGNHGRMSKSASEKSNWDNVIYQTLKYMSIAWGDTYLNVDCNFEAFYVFPIQDKQVMIYHHGTKHLGTPAMQVKVAGWIEDKKFDLAIHGHWHHLNFDSQFGRMVIKNGSLPGADDLAERMGVGEPPRQAWFLVRQNEPVGQFGCFEWSQELVNT